MTDYISRRVSARYDRIERFLSVANKPKHPRKGTILVECENEELADVSDYSKAPAKHYTILIVGAPLKWIFGHPCWNNPAFKTKPRLIDKGSGEYILPSYQT